MKKIEKLMSNFRKHEDLQHKINLINLRKKIYVSNRGPSLSRQSLKKYCFVN